MNGGATTTIGMASVWTALSENITAAKLGDELAGAIPFIAMAALFAFGFWIMRKAVKRASHGKSV